MSSVFSRRTSGSSGAQHNSPLSPNSSRVNQRSTRSPSLLIGQLASSSIYYNRSNSDRLMSTHSSSPRRSLTSTRRRSHLEERSSIAAIEGKVSYTSETRASFEGAEAKCASAQKLNDSMVYLDGPQVYTCAQCRTHLSTHDEIISKSFHGRHGRAYLFDYCVNVDIGPAEERPLITGLHSVCDIFCKRCKNLVGWTYVKAYEASEKYKEGKYILEKINLHMEESDYYDVVAPPVSQLAIAGSNNKKWKLLSAVEEGKQILVPSK
eukprot:scaffold1992_cov113-Cylindrotheca_fusiformis.AAC.2